MFNKRLSRFSIESVPFLLLAALLQRFGPSNRLEYGFPGRVRWSFIRLLSVLSLSRCHIRFCRPDTSSRCRFGVSVSFGSLCQANSGNFIRSIVPRDNANFEFVQKLYVLLGFRRLYELLHQSPIIHGTITESS